MFWKEERYSYVTGGLNETGNNRDKISITEIFKKKFVTAQKKQNKKCFFETRRRYNVQRKF